MFSASAAVGKKTVGSADAPRALAALCDAHRASRDHVSRVPRRALRRTRCPPARPTSRARCRSPRSPAPATPAVTGGIAALGETARGPRRARPQRRVRLCHERARGVRIYGRARRSLRQRDALVARRRASRPRLLPRPRLIPRPRRPRPPPRAEAPPGGARRAPSQTDPEAARFVAAVMAYAAVTAERPRVAKGRARSRERVPGDARGRRGASCPVVGSQKKTDGGRAAPSRAARRAGDARRAGAGRVRGRGRRGCRGNKACRRRLRRGDDERRGGGPGGDSGRGQPESPRATRRTGLGASGPARRPPRRSSPRSRSPPPPRSRAVSGGRGVPRLATRRSRHAEASEGRLPGRFRRGAARARRVWVRPPRVGAQSDVRARRWRAVRWRWRGGSRWRRGARPPGPPPGCRSEEPRRPRRRRRRRASPGRRIRKKPPSSRTRCSTSAPPCPPDEPEPLLFRRRTRRAQGPARTRTLIRTRPSSRRLRRSGRT